MSKRAVAIVVAGAVGLALAACSSKKKTPSEPPAINGFDAIPAGTRVLVGADLAKLKTSRLVRRGVAAMFERDGELKARIEGIADECKLVPGESVTSLLIGLGEGPSDLIMVVVGTFEENALAACVQKRVTDGGGRLTTKPIGGRTTYRADNGNGQEPVWFALGSPTSLIVAGSEAWLGKGLGEGPRLAASADAKAMLAEVPTDASLWAVGWVPEEVAGQLEKMTQGAVAGPRRMAARLDFDGGVQARLAATMASKKDANALKLLADGQQAAMVAVAQKWGLGRLLAKLEVRVEGQQLVMAISADEKELSDLLAAVDSAGPDTQNPPSPNPDAGPVKSTTPVDAAVGEEEERKNHGQGNPPSDGKAPPRR